MAGQELEGFGGTPEQAAQAVALLKSLSHEGRLQMLCLLIDRDLSVSEIADALGASPVSVSQQLMRLRAEGIVSTKRNGKKVIYHLARDEVTPVLAALRESFCRP